MLGEQRRRRRARALAVRISNYETRRIFRQKAIFLTKFTEYVRVLEESIAPVMWSSTTCCVTSKMQGRGIGMISGKELEKYP